MKQQDIQFEVFRRIADAGALTTRRIVRECGPRPNWQGALDRGALREVHTVYGPVLALTPKARERMAPRFDLPYLAGPSALADRAYQMDALSLLEEEGYTLARHEYKRSGGVGRQAGTTSQIVRTVLRVPRRIEAQLEQDWGFVFAPKYDATVGASPEVLGHPALHASISGGGLDLAGLRRLYRRYRLDIDTWRHPLLVAVPDDTPYRAWLRTLTAQHREAEAAVDRLTGQRILYPYTPIRLIVLPLPGR